MVDCVGPMMMDVDNIENKEHDASRVKLPTSKEELPNSIIITNVPEEVFSDSEQRANFQRLFTDLEDDAHFDFLKSFRRVRLIFAAPEHATAAKLIVQHLSFNGQQLKAFFTHRVLLRSSACPHLQPPPVNKQWMISPPCSPPLGWEQTREMAPVVCSFDLMARLAAFSVDDQYEVHDGGIGGNHPRIVVSPCETPLNCPSAIEMPRTPRPEMEEDE